MDVTLDRVRGEFLEMPGLRLTATQAQRLFGGEPARCLGALDALVQARFLCITGDGHYERLLDSPVCRTVRVRVMDA